jgi:phytol kinase
MLQTIFYQLRIPAMALIMSLVLGLFGLAEWIRLKLRIRTEITRKGVHLTVGAVILSFPYLLNSHVQVLILSAGFLLLLIISLQLGFLQAINKINRRSYGSMAYPVAIYLCFVCYEWKNDIAFYLLPVGIFVICDPMAAWAGMSTKWKPFRIWHNEQKTVAGTLAFFSVALLITFLYLYFFANLPLSKLMFWSVTLAFITAITEAATPLGLDNLTVPASALLTLHFLQ